MVELSGGEGGWPGREDRGGRRGGHGGRAEREEEEVPAVARYCPRGGVQRAVPMNRSRHVAPKGANRSDKITGVEGGIA